MTWRTEEAGIPKHEVTSIEYLDMRRNYGVQTAVIKFGNKGNRTKMSRFMMQYKAWNPSSTTAQSRHGSSTKSQVDIKKHQTREKEGTT